ncbi:integrase core domain-containing protein [Xanthocytophaga flava]
MGYNQFRPHSSLKGLTPCHMEEQTQVFCNDQLGPLI